jgi:DNA-binding Lrp family transcriptional regulator
MLTKTDKALLQFFQDSFPLEVRPFRTAAARFAMSESGLVSRLKSLKERGAIRYLGGIFDPKKLGVYSVLCAASVTGAKLEKTARLISAMRGVSHNYLRSGDPNLWFTLSARSEAASRAAVAAISRRTGLKIIQLPAEKVFKIDARFSLAARSRVFRHRYRRAVLRPGDKRRVICLNRPFPLSSRPFKSAALRLGSTEEKVVSDIRGFLDAGLMRRFGLILGHTRVGLRANCMAAWRVPSGKVASAARLFAGTKEITHCYLRRTAPGWPYNVYTMVHCASRPACLRLLARLSRGAGVKEYRPLFTVREFKKTKADLASVL